MGFGLTYFAIKGAIYAIGGPIAVVTALVMAAREMGLKHFAKTLVWAAGKALRGESLNSL